MTAFDILVIGGGIAGASVAAELAGERRVAILEMENSLGYHSTGRSAAVYAPAYGPAPIRALTRAAGAFYNEPYEGFCEASLLSPAKEVILAREDQLGELDAVYQELSQEAEIERLSPSEAQEILPILRPNYAAGALVDLSCSLIDVDALHQGYIRLGKERGVTVVTKAEVISAEYRSSAWHVTTAAGTFTAPVVVNAAGAWADHVGEIFGAETIGLTPKRRTALMIATPEGVTLPAGTLCVDVDEEFYIKSETGRLLISPANEDPMPPCDVRPDEMDIAICIDRIERAFDLSVRRIETKWAGLRSFVADKCPVAGFSRQAEGFYWLAGQGGYGIQTAPALSRYAATAVLGSPLPEDILNQGLEIEQIAVGRVF